MNFQNLVTEIGRIHEAAIHGASQALNRLLNIRNWIIGAWLVEYEQNGQDRAEYGKNLLQRVAEQLSKTGHTGLSSRNLRNFRQLALSYSELELGEAASNQALPPIWQTSAKSLQQAFPALTHRKQTASKLAWRNNQWFEKLFTTLSFSHLLELSRIEDPMAKAFYEIECIKSQWSVRELKRQRDSMLYERVGLSKDKDAVMALANDGKLIDTPSTIIRDPYVLEFLGIEKRAVYKESDLENALLNHLKQFIHELGRDFCFVEQQLRITFGAKHHYLDLLFYHRTLCCLIAIDLKIGAFQNEYIGQMNFYLNFLAENLTKPNENPPVGILLCADKDAEQVHYATAGLERSIFVSRYMVELPSEKQLATWLHEECRPLLRS